MQKTQQIKGLDVPTVDSIAGEVTFTRRQYLYLDKIFGEVVGTASTSNEQLRFNCGARSVVHHVKGLIRD